jgi:hypothetical protein
MVLCVVPIWWGVMFSWVLAGLWIFVAAPMLLRAIWKRTPVVPR